MSLFLAALLGMTLALAFLLGIVAGLRSFLPLAAVSWAAREGAIPVSGTPMAFLSYKYTPIILTALAIAELIADKLPTTPSRKTLGPFAARVVIGAICGFTIGVSRESLLTCVALGTLGGVLGTLGGASLRANLARAFHRDLPAALVEDVLAIAIAAGSIILLNG